MTCFKIVASVRFKNMDNYLTGTTVTLHEKIKIVSRKQAESEAKNVLVEERGSYASELLQVVLEICVECECFQ